LLSSLTFLLCHTYNILACFLNLTDLLSMITYFNPIYSIWINCTDFFSLDTNIFSCAYLFVKANFNLCANVLICADFNVGISSNIFVIIWFANVLSYTLDLNLASCDTSPITLQRSPLFLTYVTLNLWTNLLSIVS
jgi:hypothetical protein